MREMTFHDWALDFTEDLDSGSEVGEAQVNIDPVTHYVQLRSVRVLIILFTVHRARRVC